MYNEDFEKQICSEIQRRINDNLEMEAFLTDGLYLQTREIVRRSKRAYFGAYTKSDPQNTIWYPVTKGATDSIAANLDFDLRDIRITPLNSDCQATATLITELLHQKQKEFRFGLLLNEVVHNTVLCGTSVVRTWEEDGKPKSMMVDLENFVTDAQTSEPNWYAERMTIPKEDIPTDFNLEYTQDSGVTKLFNLGLPNRNEIVIWRYEGLMPRGWVNGIESDDKPIWGALLISNLLDSGTPHIQRAELIGKDRDSKTYDHCQLYPNSARFIGTGVGEAIRDLQKWSNQNINNMMNAIDLHAKGLKLIRAGAGIAPSMVNALEAGLTIQTKDPEKDVRILPQQDVSGSLGNVQEFIQRTIDRFTGNTQISQGQVDRGALTATQSAQEAGFSNVRFAYSREPMAMMFEKIAEKWLKIVKDNMKEEEVINVTNQAEFVELAEELSKLDSYRTARKALKQFGPQAAKASMEVYNPQYFLTKRMKQNTFKLLKSSVKDFEGKVDLTISNESSDPQTKAKNMLELVPLIPAARQDPAVMSVVESLFGLLGLSTASLKQQVPPPMNQPINPTQ